MTQNIMIALDALSALFQLALNTIDATNKINSVIERARKEGRDITNEELDEILASRKELEADWKSLAPDE